MARFILSKFIRVVSPCVFPWGTFWGNVLGCFILGLIYGLLAKGFQLSEGMKLFLTVGFCGGFTTFSTFINENYQLLEQGLSFQFLLYAASSLVAGFFLLYAGYQVARII